MNLLKNCTRIIYTVPIVIGLTHSLQAQETNTPDSSPSAMTNTAPVLAKAPRTIADAINPAPVMGTSGHNKLLKRAEDKNIQLVFLGDSITAYWLRAGLPVWTKYYSQYDAGDFGIPGETTGQTIGHLEGGILDGLKPKAVVILIGTNNIGKFRDQPEWVAAGIQKIVAIVSEKLPQSQIVLLSIFPCGKKNDPWRSSVAAVNAIISKTDFGPQVHYLDFGDKFLDSNGELPKEIFPDLLHPSLQGYQIWAENMQPILDPLMK